MKAMSPSGNRFEAIWEMVSDNVPDSKHHGAPKHRRRAARRPPSLPARCGRKLTLRYSGNRHDILHATAVIVARSIRASRAASPSGACASMMQLKRFCCVLWNLAAIAASAAAEAGNREQA